MGGIDPPSYYEYQLALSKWKGKKNAGNLPTIRKTDFSHPQPASTLLDYPDEVNLKMYKQLYNSI